MKSIFALLVIASGILSATTATYSRGVLHVTIPYVSQHAGVGRLSIEVLDPQDQPVSSLEKRAEVGAEKGEWQVDLRLNKPLPTEDLVWHRLRYLFVYTDLKTIEGTESISQILRLPIVHILGQRSYLSGAPAAVRVISDSKGTLKIELSNRVLFDGPLDSEAKFQIPSGLAGSYPLRYIVDTPIGSTEFTQQIQIQDKSSILLTTEKPIYQPSQTIHARALALDRANHQATAGRDLTFEVEDSRGNKVFKRATQTDKFGIASAEFSLADEVNLGTYHLRAVMGGNTAEIALNVEKYVLPKFKVAIDLADKTKHGYRPGEHVTGSVHANYFFGKPLSNAEVPGPVSGKP